MNHFMTLQCAVFFERFFASLASIWSFTSVNSFMISYTGFLPEHSRAVGTWIRFFTCMNSFVNFCTGFLPEHLRTISTCIRLLASMYKLMTFPCTDFYCKSCRYTVFHQCEFFHGFLNKFSS